VSEKHANFFLVDGGGRAQDIVDLLVLVRQRVFDDSGIQLESEHRFVGFEVTA
jgi:UDP-N-acetylmuramate dehydrogenase